MSHPSTRRSARSTGDGAGAGASPNLPGSGVPPASMSSGHGNGGGGGGSNSLPVGGGAGDGGGSHRSSPASHMSAASGSSNTSRGSRVTSSRRGRGLRGRSVSPPPVTGSGAASMASPIASSSRHTSPHASPRFSPHSVSSQSRAAAGASSAAAAAAPAAASAASAAPIPHLSPPSQIVLANGERQVNGTSNSGGDGGGSNRRSSDDEAADRPTCTTSKTVSSSPPVVSVGGASLSPTRRADPHEQSTPKHNHLSQPPPHRSHHHHQQGQHLVQRHPQQRQKSEQDRPPSPIRGPSSAAAAAAAAAKALRSGHRMMRPPGGGRGYYNVDGRHADVVVPPPAMDAYGYHNIPYSPEDSAAAAYYARQVRGGGGFRGGYYDHDMVGRRLGAETNWPDEAEQKGSADDADPGPLPSPSAVAGHYHSEGREQAYFYHHRHHQHQHHHHNGASYYEDPDSRYRPNYHSDYAHHRHVRIGGPPPGAGEGEYERDGRGANTGYPGWSHPGWRERTASPEKTAAGADDSGRSRERQGGRYASPPSEREHREGGTATSLVVSSNNVQKGKVVIGGPSPIHVARGMSTSPNNNVDDDNGSKTGGRHVTPHQHDHNTRHASRKQNPQHKSSTTTSSIFRGRPGHDTSAKEGIMDNYDDDDEDSPHRILLSLSRDAHSFEDKGSMSGSKGTSKLQVVDANGKGNADMKDKSAAKTSDKKPVKGSAKPTNAKKAGKANGRSSVAEKRSRKTKKTGSKKATKKANANAIANADGNACPPSPEGPPRIYHSHSHRRYNDALSFDPMKSPNGKTNMLELQGPMIDNAPSFALFNTSFDSLGEPSKLGMTMSGGLGITASFSFGLGVPSIKSRDEGTQGGGVVSGSPYPVPSNSLRLSGSGSIGGFAPSNSFGEQRPPTKGAKLMVLGGGSTFASDERGAAGIILNGTSSGDGSSGPSIGRERSGSSVTPLSFRKAEFAPRSVIEFYGVLTCHKQAFEGYTFLLPGLKEALAESNEGKEAKAETDGVKSSPGNAASAVISTPPRSGSPKVTSPHSGGSASPDRGAGSGAESPKSRFLYTPDRSLRSSQSSKSQPSDAVIARRRVKSAICAFGGSGYATEHPKENSVSMEDDDDDTKLGANASGPDNSKSSIFRTKKEGEGHTDDSPGNAKKADANGTAENLEDTRSEARKLYDEKLPLRFYENEDRLSWEIEDDPPVGNAADDVGDAISSSRKSTSSRGTANSSSNKRSYPDDSGALYHSDRDGKKMRQTYKADGGMMMPHHPGMSTTSAAFVGSPQPKMRYRCKLCGQPKQNHVCPYQSSLQRSLGTMVYKAVNAFTAEEPGEVAPALSTMNNFVASSGGAKSEPSSTATTPSRGIPKSGPGTMLSKSVGRKLAHITPQSVSRTNCNSPGDSSLSTVESPPRGGGGRSPVRSTGRTPRSSGRRHKRDDGRGKTTPSHDKRALLVKKLRFPSDPGSSSSREGDLLFVESADLKAEQFRIVRPRHGTGEAPEDTPYHYAAVPLPYGQRKRLSDKLFGVSKEVPNLTDECAHVLREARKKDMWDTAVAELYAQVLVAMACPSQDERLDGLRWHLLTEHGIAC
mmetsp:Transcript_28807/g.63433  ORF Transcript_28807/g.63433 Transcript_28807/m.63433 type:complete len:1583 (+) Transcript_28807:356-5104(+)